jgi:putative colanic acid biosynthesis UDP-glucose lipid carrier transferase
MAYFAYLGIFRTSLAIEKQEYFLIFITSGTAFMKFLSFFLLRLYRRIGRNFRRVIVLGSDQASKKISQLFNTQNTLGYRLMGFFSDKESKSENYLGKIAKSYEYMTENSVHEVYCSTSSLKPETIKKVTAFAKENQIIIKLIPDAKNLYGKNLELEYYKTIPVLEVKSLPFDYPETRIIKRIFDIIFSFLVCVFILSWLTPLLWIIIKLESKGPLFFSQKRSGLNGNEFICFKFRSMKMNKESDDIQVSLDDPRVTKVGSFIRRTSIDELPQFLNVLIGDMSVVGPRPHMNKQSLRFEKEVNNYIRRNAVKPGITGLAQISGYRGEIKRKSDIDNRVRLDIFYIENWSFFLDIKIILSTIANLFKGEEKAY